MWNCSNTAICYGENVYRGTFTLPGRARDWRFYYQNCTMPPAIKNVSGCLYTEAGLNNFDFPDSTAKNWSPIWHNRRPNLPGYTTDTIVNYPAASLCA